MLFKTQLTPQLTTLLMKEPDLNLNIFGVLENFRAEQLTLYTDSEEAPTGLLIKRDDYFHFLYTRNTAFIDAIFEEVLTEGFYGFSGLAKELAEDIMSRYPLDWSSPCDLYSLSPEDFNPALKTRPVQSLGVEHANLVDEYYPYRHEHSIHDITECIANRPTAAYFENGVPVSWLLMHNDNSLGFMHTLDEHRRHGYAVDVTIDLCERLIASGKQPYLQIVKINGMSPGLALKCGFKKIGEVTWCGIVVGRPDGIEEFEAQKAIEANKSIASENTL